MPSQFLADLEEAWKSASEAINQLKQKTFLPKMTTW
jgi:hypothetical protein